MKKWEIIDNGFDAEKDMVPKIQYVYHYSSKLTFETNEEGFGLFMIDQQHEKTQVVGTFINLTHWLKEETAKRHIREEVRKYLG